MKMTQFVDLLVIDGPDKGMRFSIEQGSFRIIGKREEPSIKENLIETEINRSLNADQQEIIYLHLKNFSNPSLLQYQPRGPDILLNDPSVNRIHAMVLFDEQTTSIADLISNEGIFVQKKQINQANLQNNDVISIGNSKLMIFI